MTKKIAGGFEVSWMPPSTAVEGDDFSATYPLEVELTVTGDEGTLSVRKTIPLGVYVASPPLTVDHLSVEVEPKVPSFTEGVEDRFKLVGKILGGAKASSSKLRILNLPDGAKQTPVADGIEVRWTPPATTITGDDYTGVYSLRVEMSAVGDEGSVAKTETFNLGIYVKNPPLREELLAIESSPSRPRFEENVEEKVVLSGKLLGGLEATTQLSVVNPPTDARLKTLPGGDVELVWTPPLDTITGDEFMKTHALEVVLTATDDEGNKVQKTETIDLAVYISAPPLGTHSVNIGVESSESGFVEGEEVSFVEGVEGRFKILGHLLGGVEADYKIKVLNPPPDAKVTSKGGDVEFVWTPPFTTVTGEDNYTSVYELEVELTATNVESEVVVNKTIPLRVSVASTPLAPRFLEIFSEPATVSLTEGVEETFKVLSNLSGGVKGTSSLAILNLPEGASVKDIAGGIEVSWTPPFTTVGGDDFSASYPLEVELTVTGDEGTLRVKKTIPLGVYVASTPLTADLLSMEVNPKVPSFTEGVQDKFRVIGKLLGGVKATYGLKILNLPKGARKAPVPGGFEVTWTPPATTITGDDYTGVYPLRVEMTATGDEGSVAKTETFNLGIYVKNPPLREELLAIGTTPTVSQFKENEEGKVVLSGKLLGGLVATTSLSVVNPPTDARVKTLSGGDVELVWTPPPGTVSGGGAVGFYSLEVDVTAMGSEGNRVTKREVIPLAVYVTTLPLSADLLAFDLDPQVANFVEGQEGSLRILGKLLGGGSSPAVRVDILNLPPGATKNPVAGGVEFKWTPPATTVTQGNYYTQTSLRVRLSARKGIQEVSKEVSIPLLVRVNTRQVPVVQNVVFQHEPVYENSASDITITVFDPSASGLPPLVHFVPVAGSKVKSAYRYVFLQNEEPVQDGANPGVWTYKGRLSFGSRNVIKKPLVPMIFGVMAYSPYGIASDVHEVIFNVLNRMRPVSGENSPYPHKVPYGRHVSQSFTIVDYAREGILTTDFAEACGALKKKYKCRCKAAKKSEPWKLDCRLEWFVYKGAPKEVIVSYWVKNTNPGDPGDALQTRNRIIFHPYR